MASAQGKWAYAKEKGPSEQALVGDVTSDSIERFWRVAKTIYMPIAVRGF